MLTWSDIETVMQVYGFIFVVLALGIVMVALLKKLVDRCWK